MRRRECDKKQNLSFMELQTAHNSSRILLVGSIYCGIEIIGLILSSLGFFESDIRLPIFIVVCLHLLYLPLLACINKGLILKNPMHRYYSTLFYSVLILAWGGIFNVLVYLQKGDVNVYSMVVLIVASLLLFSPRTSAVLFTAGFFLFASLAMAWDTAESDANAMVFKILIITLIGWALSRGNYQNRLHLYEVEMKLLKLNASLKDLTLRDSMTGLFNNAYIYDFIQKTLDNLAGKMGTLAVLMLDLDHFKLVNDSYGHAVGDRVLKRASETMLACTRDTDMVGRYGGEEFIIILTDTRDDRAHLIAQRIRTEIEALQFEEGFSVSCSIVLTLYNGEDGVDLIEKADAFMYDAKKQGRNRVVG
jgi:diguanylate cyclase (GGDEF)-like protein